MLSDRERDIMIMQKYGEIPRRGPELPMCATIYDEEDEYERDEQIEYSGLPRPF